MPVRGWLARRMGRLRTIFRRNRLDDELREEVEGHIQMRTAQLIERGMDPRDAAFEARRIFGNVTAIREETRDMWGVRWLETLAQDVRYGARMLRRSPLVTAIAVVSLAIGIGASTAAFSLIDATLLKMLPVHDPDSLVLFRWVSGPRFSFASLNGYASQNESGLSSTSFSRAAFEAVRTGAASQITVFGFADLYDVNVSIDGRPDSARGQAVTGGFFSTLGMAPAAGRAILPDDERPGAAPVAMLSYRYAERHFGAAARALGRPLVVNGVPFTVVGVTPRNFRGTLQVGQVHDVTIPAASYAAVTRAEDPADPNHWWILMMGRLQPGVTIADVQPAVDLLVKQTVSAARPELPPDAWPRVVLEPGGRGQVEDRRGMREPLRVIAAVVAIVLLVACANVANLLLARGRARVHEIAVRVAIGASRRRVVRQLLTESLLLTMLGAALGVLLAQWIAAALVPALADAPDALDLGPSIDWRVCLFVAGLASACSIIIGLAPAIRATDVRIAGGLQDGARGADAGHGRERLASSLVVIQVALSTVLLAAASLLVYSAVNLQRLDPGFDPSGTLIFAMDARLNGYDEAQARSLYERALERLSALPGVRSASLSSHTLMSNSSSIGVSRAAGTPAPPPESEEAQQFERKNLTWRLNVEGRFFETMGIRLLRGRTFTIGDSAEAPPVAIVNESLARRMFGSTDVVGRRLVLGLRPGSPEMEIVGLAADARYTSLRRDPPPTVYLPYTQQPTSRATFAVRAAGEPLALAPLVRETMRRLDATVPVVQLRTQDEQIQRSLGRERLFARLSTLLGVVTLVLSTVGLYGLLAYAVTRRTPEIGIRMALGAAAGRVRWMIMRQSIVLVALGLVLGVAGARAGTSFLESLLFGLTPTDPRALAVAAVVMVAVTLAAAYVPARRASRVDPVIALRQG